MKPNKEHQKIIEIAQLESAAEMQNPKKFCGCIDAHHGVKYLGIWSLIQSLLVFVTALKMLYDGVWWGIHLMMFNGVYLM